MIRFDIGVIGAGPAGLMAALQAGSRGCKTALFEKNTVVGKKLVLTGGARCNITNTASLEEFFRRYTPNGKFLRTAFSSFFRNDLLNFFKQYGLSFITEPGGKIYPAYGKAIAVQHALEQACRENGVQFFLKSPVGAINRRTNGFLLSTGNDLCFCRIIIAATGGIAYPHTGSTGDGFLWARQFGHTVTPLVPGLVSFVCKEPWIPGLAGISLNGVRLNARLSNKTQVSESGEVLFTHKGISGFPVLDMSNVFSEHLSQGNIIPLIIDTQPSIDEHTIDKKLQALCIYLRSKQIKTLLKEFVPERVGEILLTEAGIDFRRKISAMTKQERRRIVQILKKLTVTVTGTAGFDDAMVTVGGIPTKEINPSTLESRIVENMYFAGEIIDATGVSGGYNLQQAFSTGYLAGTSAASKSKGHPRPSYAINM